MSFARAAASLPPFFFQRSKLSDDESRGR